MEFGEVSNLLEENVEDTIHEQWDMVAREVLQHCETYSELLVAYTNTLQKFLVEGTCNQKHFVLKT